jgi:hypothetical protein
MEVLHELTVNFRIEKPEQRTPRSAAKPRDDAPPQAPGENPGPGGQRP